MTLRIAFIVVSILIVGKLAEEENDLDENQCLSKKVLLTGKSIMEASNPGISEFFDEEMSSVIFEAVICEKTKEFCDNGDDLKGKNSSIVHRCKQKYTKVIMKNPKDESSNAVQSFFVPIYCQCATYRRKSFKNNQTKNINSIQ